MTLVAAAPKDNRMLLRLAVALSALVIAAIVVFGLAALIVGPPPAQVKNPFGVGIHEGAMGTSSLARWLLAQQEWFNRGMLDGLKAARDHSGFALGMILLAFGYGVFHAGGPGHGKAVISAYLISNEHALRRGIALSIASALLQALVAIAIVLGAALVLRATALGMTRIANQVEIISFAAIALFGLILTWRKAGPVAAYVARSRMSGMGFLRKVAQPRGRHDEAAHRHDAHALGQAPEAADIPPHAHHHHHHDNRYEHHDFHHHHHDEHRNHHDPYRHDPGHSDHEHCVHHVPAEIVGSAEFSWRDAAPVVFAAGSRPCSGAILVLVFALSQGLLAAGLVAVLAMAAGVAITVSGLATLAVFARRIARRMAGGEGRFAFAGSVVELLVAAFVATLGLGLMNGLAVISGG
jgi:nickel/cobalt transporter (NicO) family protein